MLNTYAVTLDEKASRIPQPHRLVGSVEGGGVIGTLAVIHPAIILLQNTYNENIRVKVTMSEIIHQLALDSNMIFSNTFPKIAIGLPKRVSITVSYISN